MLNIKNFMPSILSCETIFVLIDIFRDRSLHRTREGRSVKTRHEVIIIILIPQVFSINNFIIHLNAGFFNWCFINI